ncbi:MAG: hypothetical protein V3U83_04370, partial [Acidobacteriota bacterium]
RPLMGSAIFIGISCEWAGRLAGSDERIFYLRAAMEARLRGETAAREPRGKGAVAWSTGGDYL